MLLSRMGRPNARYMERQIEGERSGSSAVCVRNDTRLSPTGKLRLIVKHQRPPSAHPLILVGVFEPQVVGEGSHGDGQLADLL